MNKREQAWAYFELHSRQRMQVFNFYIVISTALLAALFTLIDKLGHGLMAISLEIVSILLPFIFWALDQRTRELIKHSEHLIKKLEQEDSGNNIDLFSSEAPTKVLTYTKLFRVVYLIFAAIGVTLIVHSLININ